MQPDNLISLKDDMVAFIAGHGMRRLSGYVNDDVPAVLFEEEDADSWKDFVEHAKAAGSPFVTMSEVVLEKADVVALLDHIREQAFPDHDSPEIDEVQSLIQYVGKTGYLQIGFPFQGVMFLYEAATEWYDRFQQFMESMAELGGIIVDDGDNDE
jgi:hypothetical protein